MPLAPWRIVSVSATKLHTMIGGCCPAAKAVVIGFEKFYRLFERCLDLAERVGREDRETLLEKFVMASDEARILADVDR
jgi:hypothetical protein